MKRFTVGITTYFVITLLFYISYSPQAFAQDRNIVLDPRLGVTHVGSVYPDRHTTGDYMSWGANKVYRLGFNSTEIWIANNMCFGNNPTTEPYGPYQSGEALCEPKPSIWTKAKSLTEYVQQPEVVATFDIPLKRFFLTAYPLNTTFRSARRKEVTGIPYTQAELDSLRQEYYDFTKYLLLTYKDSPKVFAVMPMVTMDRWLSGRDFEKDENPGVCTASDSAPQERIDNMIAYFSTIAGAMSQAREDAGTTQSKVYLTCEVNSVLCPMRVPAIKAAINAVVPRVGCDLVSYAAYELLADAWTNHRNEPNYLKQVFNYMATQAPDHSDFGGKNIAISEVGIREQQGTQEGIDWFSDTFIKTALNWGMPYIELWALAFCHVFNPSQAQQNDPAMCPGWWMFKPDGSLSMTYRALRTRFQMFSSPPTISPTQTPIPSVTPSPSPVPTRTPSPSPTSIPSPSSRPGDLNIDGRVDIFDFNLLISNFGSPYTIFDFNQIVANFLI